MSATSHRCRACSPTIRLRWSPNPDPSTKARIGIRWHTGATDEITLARAVHPGTAKRSPSPAVAMVTRLGPTTPTAAGTGRPAQRGRAHHRHRCPVRPQSCPVDPPRLPCARPGSLHLACEIPASPTPPNGSPTSTGVVYDWIKTGKLAARRGSGNRLCIPWTERVEAECRCRIAQSAHLNPVIPPTPNPETRSLNTRPICRCHRASCTGNQRPIQSSFPADRRDPINRNVVLQEGAV